jgi:hypothetical protein
MKWLYKYPQLAYPYDNLIATNRSRTRQEFEYEVLDTGVFDEDRYFDVFVEYVKPTPDDIVIQITVFNRGPEPATLHVLAPALVPEPVVVGGKRAATTASGPRQRWRRDCGLGFGTRRAVFLLPRRSFPAVH